MSHIHASMSLSFPTCEMMIGREDLYSSCLLERSVLLRYWLFIERLACLVLGGLHRGEEVDSALQEPLVWGNQTRAPRMKMGPSPHRK